MLSLRRMNYLHWFAWISVILFHFTYSEDSLDVNIVKNKWIPVFQNFIQNFSQNILAADKIQNEISQNVVKDKFIQLQDTEENSQFMKILSDMFSRFSEVRSSLTEFKVAMENEVKNIENGTPSMNGPLRECCKVNSNTYVGRFRESVTLGYECVGTKDGSSFDKVKARNAFKTLKDNYNNVSSILWQYFSTMDGHFVQYPSKNKHCNSDNHIISPLTQEWFIGNLFREVKNIVILYDIGISTTTLASPPLPMDRAHFIKSAVQRLLETLTPDDKFNVVAFNEDTYVPTRCDDRLFTADQRNVDYITTTFIPQLKNPKGGSDYSKAFEKAYNLLATEKNLFPNDTTGEDTIILITDGVTSPDFDTTQMYQKILEGLQKMQGGVRHFVYVLESSPNLDTSIKIALKNVSKQNFQDWQGVSDVKSYEDLKQTRGSFNVITSPTKLISSVAKYYTRLPYQRENEVTVMGPTTDKATGLLMTFTTPVYHNDSKQVYGVAAVDVSVAAIFREITNFWIGVHSYAFVIENRHAHVLLHPKLTDPAETKHEDPIFPTLEVLEPTFTTEQKQKLMTAEESTHIFKAKVHPGRSSYKANLKEPLPEQDTTVFYAKVPDTHFVVVMVLFDVDKEIILSKNGTKDSYYGPYHRIDELLGSPSSNRPEKETVCSLYKNFVVPDESVVKLAPTVFTKPEMYKFSSESQRDIFQINEFLVNAGDTSLIHKDLKKEIQHVLRATNATDQFWRPSSKLAVDRFLGTTSGVFRLFPGIQLYNTYNHMSYQWFKKAVSRPTDLIFMTGKVTHFSQKNYVIISKALSENVPHTNLVDILQGVVGATITHRQLTAILLNNVAPCSGGDVECHLLDDNGYLLNFGDDFHGKYHQHLVHSFPWLGNILIQKGFMKPVWCTSMSEGQHFLSYSLETSVMSSELKTDKCSSYVIVPVPDTNLYLLVLYNRKKNNCIETSAQNCSSCYTPASTVKCTHCLADYINHHYCQCPCNCQSDFNQCTNQFTDPGSQNFPHRACYEEPYNNAPQRQILGPHKEPGPNIKPCPIPCVIVEEKTQCEFLQHCKWKTQDIYPTCVWKTEEEIKNYSYSLTTKMTPPTLPTPAVPHRTTGSSAETLNPHVPITEPHQQSINMPTKSPPGGTSHGIDIPTPHMSTLGSTSQQSALVSTPKHPPKQTSQNVDTASYTSVTQSPTQKPQTAMPQGSTNMSTKPQTPSQPASQAPAEQSTKSENSQNNGHHQTSTKSHIGSNGSQTTEKSNNSTGLIVGLVLTAILLVLMVSFIIYKFYSKKFRQAAVDNTASKYVQRSVFDGAAFSNRSGESTLISSPPLHIPYQHMSSTDE